MRKSVIQPKALEIIKKRLAAIKPEQYIVPQRERADDPVIGSANDTMKRLYTLRENLDKELDALYQALVALKAADALLVLTSLVVGAITSLDKECAEFETLLGVVDGMLDFEIQSESFDSDKPFAFLCSDWTIGGADQANEEETQ